MSRFQDPEHRRRSLDTVQNMVKAAERPPRLAPPGSPSGTPTAAPATAASWFHVSAADPTTLHPFSPSIACILERSYQNRERRLVVRTRRRGTQDDVDSEEMDFDLLRMTKTTAGGTERLLRRVPAGVSARRKTEPPSALVKHSIEKLKKKVNVGEAGHTHKEIRVYEVEDSFTW